MTLTEADIDYFGHYDIGNERMKNIKIELLENQKIVEKIKEWYDETQQPLPEGHIPIVSLNGLSIRLKEILSANKDAQEVEE